MGQATKTQQRTARTGRAWILAGLSMLVVALWLVIGRAHPVWLVVGAAVFAIAAAVLAQGAKDRARPPDALSPWRSFRAAKRMTLSSAKRDRISLTLELTHEWDLEGEVATLRFDGVQGLSLQQPFDHALHFDYLMCDDHMRDDRKSGAGKTGAGKKPRYRVRDHFGEVLDFRCESFECLDEADSSNHGESRTT